MTLYFNGCSFTFGAELQDPVTQAWPALVAKSLGRSFTNFAVPGGTNDRTVYQTLQNLHNHDCFFIAWTFYARFTEFNPVDNFEINFNPALNLDPSLHLSNDLKTNYKKYKRYGEMYYKHWFNELYECKKWLQQIILLQSFLARHDKKYIMLNTTHNNLDSWMQPTGTFIESVRPLLAFFDRLDDAQLLAEQREIQRYAQMIDQSRFVRWNDWCIIDLQHQVPLGPGGHILEDGHRAVAEIVLNHYNTIT